MSGLLENAGEPCTHVRLSLFCTGQDFETFRCRTEVHGYLTPVPGADERKWHMKDSQGQILALDVQVKVLETFQVVLSSLGSGLWGALQLYCKGTQTSKF